MQMGVVAKLLGVDVHTKEARRAYLRRNGWRCEDAWHLNSNSPRERVSRKGENWFPPGDTIDFGVDGATAIQLTRDAVTRLRAAGWDVIASARDSGVVHFVEASRKVNRRIVRAKTVAAALRATAGDTVTNDESVH